MANSKKKGLGKGLGALIGPSSSRDDLLKPTPKKKVAPPPPAPVKEFVPTPEPEPTPEPVIESTSSNGKLVDLDPHDIRHSPKQPRQVFEEDALEDLAQSLRQDGIIQPVVVRLQDDVYELVSGERRVRAAILAEMATIPALVRDVGDDEMLKLGLIENIQRQDLNPIETAEAYRALLQEFDWTHEELAKEVGKKRETVSNSIRLLNLEPDVREAVIQGKISMGHARALLAFTSPSRQSTACAKIIADGLSVRQTEKLASAPLGTPKRPKGATVTTQDPHLAHEEDDLRRRFGTKIAIKSNEEHRGKIEIDFYNLEDLERILTLLRK